MLGRAKLFLGGVMAMFAGVLIAGGVEGMAPQGGGIFLCGLSLVGLAAWAQIREERQSGEIARRQQQEAHEQTIRIKEARQREKACDGHDWAFDDAALNVNVLCWVCLKCGAERSEKP